MRSRWLISFLFFMMLASVARAEVVVILRREAKPIGNYVRVCDIARVEGPNGEARPVAMTVLGPAPSRGETREISRWDIESRLYEMGLTARIAFSGNNVVRIYGEGVASSHLAEETEDPMFMSLGPLPGQGQGQGQGSNAGTAGLAGAGGSSRPFSAPFKPEPKPSGVARDEMDRFTLGELSSRRIANAISAYLADRYHNGPSKRQDIEVEAKVVSASADVPHDAFSITVDNELGGMVPGRGELRLSVKERPDSRVRHVDVTADIDVFAQALTAARNISRGDSLVARDVTVGRVKMEAGKRYLPPRPDAVDGLEAKRQLRPGEAIQAADASPGQAVKRGAMVQLKNSGFGWDIQSTVKAHGGGTVGDIITVENVTNKTKFPARITGTGTVEALVKKDGQ